MKFESCSGRKGVPSESERMQSHPNSDIAKLTSGGAQRLAGENPRELRELGIARGVD